MCGVLNKHIIPIFLFQLHTYCVVWFWNNVLIVAESYWETRRCRWQNIVAASCCKDQWGCVGFSESSSGDGDTLSVFGSGFLERPQCTSSLDRRAAHRSVDADAAAEWTWVFYTRGFNITDGDLGKSSSPICLLWMPPPGLDRLDLFVL